MSKPELIEFEWNFAPPELFEERCELLCCGYGVSVDSGKARVRAEIGGGQAVWESVANEIHERLYAYLLAAQVLGHERIELSRPSYARIRPDGGRDIFLALEGGRLNVSMGRLDASVTVGSQVAHDDRRDRIERRILFGSRAAHHVGDAVLDAILRSYSAAVNDPRNELVHLFEIRDALRDRFGGEAPARAALGVSGADWSKLGILANDEPLREGRHRGRFPGQLREATVGELDEARAVAKELIAGYVAHLDGSARRSGARARRSDRSYLSSEGGNHHLPSTADASPRRIASLKSRNRRACTCSALGVWS